MNKIEITFDHNEPDLLKSMKLNGENVFTKEIFTAESSDSQAGQMSDIDKEVGDGSTADFCTAINNRDLDTKTKMIFAFVYGYGNAAKSKKLRDIFINRLIFHSGKSNSIIVDEMFHGYTDKDGNAGSPIAHLVGSFALGALYWIINHPEKQIAIMEKRMKKLLKKLRG